MTHNKILKDLDKAIANLQEPNCKIEKIAPAILNACKMLKHIIASRQEMISEMEKDMKELEESINTLVEQNEIMQVDIQIILEFLKQNKIDISYIVTRSEIAKKIKGE